MNTQKSVAIAIKSTGRSAADIASEIEVSETTLTNWKKGLASPSAANLEKLAKCCAMPLSVLVRLGE